MCFEARVLLCCASWARDCTCVVLPCGAAAQLNSLHRKISLSNSSCEFKSAGKSLTTLGPSIQRSNLTSTCYSRNSGKVSELKHTTVLLSICITSDACVTSVTRPGRLATHALVRRVSGWKLLQALAVATWYCSPKIVHSSFASASARSGCIAFSAHAQCG